MFTDLSWSDILIFLIIALVVVGPQDLPKFLRKIGKGIGKMRRMADQFRGSFEDMARQSELDELRTELDKMRQEQGSQPAPAKEQPHDHFDQHAGLNPAPQGEVRPAQPILPEGATPAEPVQAHSAEPKS